MTEELDVLAHKMVVEGFIDVDFYLEQAGELNLSEPLDIAHHYLKTGERLGFAPSGFFDPRYYEVSNPDLEGHAGLMDHYITHGQHEGRTASLASLLISEGLDKVAIEEELVPAPDVNPTDPAYLSAFARSLRVLDQDRRYFSNKFYVSRYTDVRNIEPILHYLRYGQHEGRVHNVSLLKRIEVNEDAVNSDLPFVLIGVHEASKTGAPIVGMDLARQMAATHNVIFVSLRDGPLLEDAKELFPIVIIGGMVVEDNNYFVDYINQNYPIENGIFSSVCCAPFIYALSSSSCRITCLVHEFLEYMMPFREIVYDADLLVFSSKELLKSWHYTLEDFNRDPETVMVLAQPASGTSTRNMTKAVARAEVAAATGLDLSDATLVLAAGQVQIRKGTDIFLQIGSQLRRERGKYVSIWIGEQVSELDMAFGVWLHAQMDRSRDSSGQLPVHFEPAGPLYPVLMDAADVFLVTSRLDPLPNVALDAAARNLPVIAFGGATGLADIAERGEMNLIEVEIGAVDEVIAAIKACTGNAQYGVGKAGTGAVNGLS